MGSIQIFDLSKYIQQHKCTTYVETGTGAAECLSHAVNYPFEQFYTIDIDGDLIEKAEKQFNNPKITFIHNYSSVALNELVPTLPKDKPVLFFLDAHFPGADFHKISYEESIRQFMDEAFPLLGEIKIIKNHRDISNDVFIIDDWKLYDDTLNYEMPGWQYKNLQEELGLITKPNEIYKEFEVTHDYEINLRHQGFLFVTPKNTK
jgi:hypothetical protein